MASASLRARVFCVSVAATRISTLKSVGNGEVARVKLMVQVLPAAGVLSRTADRVLPVPVFAEAPLAEVTLRVGVKLVALRLTMSRVAPSDKAENGCAGARVSVVIRGASATATSSRVSV